MSPTANHERRARHCRTCHQPMQGHPTGRNNPCRANTITAQDFESLEDEDDQDTESEGGSESTTSYASPPPTHDASPTPSIQRVPSSSSISLGRPFKVHYPLFTPKPAPYPQRVASQPSFVIPETGAFHRKNPNYIPPFLARVRLPEPSGSLVPTVIVGSDGEPVAPSIRSTSPVASDTVHVLENDSFLLGPKVEKTSFERQACLSLPAGEFDYWPANTTLGAGPSNEYSVSDCTSSLPKPESVSTFFDILLWRASANTTIACALSALSVWGPLFVVCFAANMLGHYVTKKYLGW